MIRGWLCCPIRSRNVNVGSGKGAFLRTKKDDYHNFILKLEVKLDEPCNSGVQFRSYQRKGNGQMYVGTWPNGIVYRYEDSGDWTNCGRLGKEEEIQAILEFNGQLFAGSLPTAKVCRYSGGRTWAYTGHLDTGGGLYRRAWTLAAYDGKLFCGTVPSGLIWSLEVGKCATLDRHLQPGWRHIVAVKTKDRLKLYVDGKCVSTSSPFQPNHYDLTSKAPLKIGFGQRDFFNGKMKDVRVYNRALNDKEILDLCKR